MGFYHLKSVLVATAICAAAPTYAQVRVITGDIEHVYGPGGQVLDDAALRAHNERAERARRIENNRRQAQRRQDEADAEYQHSTWDCCRTPQRRDFSRGAIVVFVVGL